MNNKEFIESYCLKLSWEEPEAKIVRKILEECNKLYVVSYKETKMGRYINFSIHIPRKGFANGYYHIGGEIRERVVPVWKKRIELKSAKKWIKKHSLLGKID